MYKRNASRTCRLQVTNTEIKNFMVVILYAYKTSVPTE